jgi:hypothetical protein
LKVYFAIPALYGAVEVECHHSLSALYRVLKDAGIAFEEITISHCPYLSTARNTLVAMFLSDPDATDLFFIDADVGFDAAGAIKILQREESIVGGIYPLKRMAGGYPVQIREVDGHPMGRDGLVEALLMPGGFLRIKRGVFDILREHYPELGYDDSVVEVRGWDIKEAFDFFGMGSFGRSFKTEDYAFCQRWRDVGGTLWAYPDIEFEHIGKWGFKGNYHEYLLRCPGGAKDPLKTVFRSEDYGNRGSEGQEGGISQSAD